MRLSSGEMYDSALIVWTAGVTPNPTVTSHTDLPIDSRGRIQVHADLRVGAGQVIADAWAGSDNAAVPDLTGGGIDGFTVPNAQHAVRQGKLLAKNLTASPRVSGLGVAPKSGIVHPSYGRSRDIVGRSNANERSKDRRHAGALTAYAGRGWTCDVLVRR